MKIDVTRSTDFPGLLEVAVDDCFVASYAIRFKRFSFSEDAGLIDLGTLKEIINKVEKYEDQEGSLQELVPVP